MRKNWYNKQKMYFFDRKSDAKVFSWGGIMFSVRKPAALYR